MDSLSNWLVLLKYAFVVFQYFYLCSLLVMSLSIVTIYVYVFFCRWFERNNIMNSPYHLASRELWPQGRQSSITTKFFRSYFQSFPLPFFEYSILPTLFYKRFYVYLLEFFYPSYKIWIYYSSTRLLEDKNPNVHFTAIHLI